MAPNEPETFARCRSCGRCFFVGIEAGAGGECSQCKGLAFEVVTAQDVPHGVTLCMLSASLVPETREALRGECHAIKG
jgi:hypothetical protein